jgi:hypothetical protein
LVALSPTPHNMSISTLVPGSWPRLPTYCCNDTGHPLVLVLLQSTALYSRLFNTRFFCLCLLDLNSIKKNHGHLYMSIL